MASPLIVKVGGSLYDLPDLGPRLQRWLDAIGEAEVLLIPGGGPIVDVIRDLDRRHHLGEEKAHWLALRAMALNAFFLADVLPVARVIGDWRSCGIAWRNARVLILDAHTFARDDAGQPGRLPHSWSVSSDALAARVAEVMGTRRLVLLKSITLSESVDWTEAARRGYVDPHFAQMIDAEWSVRVVNLRAWPAASSER